MRLVLKLERHSVARFCKLSPLWQKNQKHLANFQGSSSSWLNYDPTLANFLCFLEKIVTSTDHKSSKIILPSDHTAFRPPSIIINSSARWQCVRISSGFIKMDESDRFFGSFVQSSCCFGSGCGCGSVGRAVTSYARGLQSSTNFYIGHLIVYLLSTVLKRRK